MSTQPTVLIQSFGFGHNDFPDTPNNALLVNLQTALRNPADHLGLRQMTGLDQPVIDHVLATPGALEVIARTVAQARALYEADLPVHVLAGCIGGRHRSVVVADQVCQGLNAQGIPARVEHLHVNLPVIRN